MKTKKALIVGLEIFAIPFVIAVIWIVLSLLFTSCKSEITEPIEKPTLSDAWSSYIWNPEYTFVPITLHLTQIDKLLDGLGSFDDMTFDLINGNYLGNTVSFSFVIHNTNFGEWYGRFEGRYENDELRGIWTIPNRAYSVWMKRNHEIKYLPKQQHNQGNIYNNY